MSDGTSVRGPRRWKLVVAGILVAVVGLLATVGAAVVDVATRVATTADPDAEGTTREPVTFEAEARSYEIVSLRSRFGDRADATQYTCDVTLADGATVEIDGAFQAVAVEVGRTESVGSFDAVAGTTTVDCRTDGGIEGQFFVKATSRWAGLATIALVVGIVGLLAGAALILLGVFTRRRPVLDTAPL